MPYARNALDGTGVYFEDDGGDGVPVVFHGGIVDSVPLLRASHIARALQALPEFRLIYVDHRGVGRSDKPHDQAAYAMPLRVADAMAVLDELGIQRAHFIGTSYGGRLGFGIGELAPERVLSLVVGGQQPYAIDREGPLFRVVAESLLASRTKAAWSPSCKRWRRSPASGSRTSSAPTTSITTPRRLRRRRTRWWPKARSARTFGPGGSGA